MNINSLSNDPGGSIDAWKESAKSYWTKVPLFSRFIVYISIIIYILSWIIQDVVILFCNIPYNTLNEFRVWTLLTTVFVNLNILTLLFALWSWLDISLNLESKNGTVHFILNFFTLNVIIQSIYVFLTVFLSFIMPSLLKKNSAGLWPLIMSLITVECLQNAEAVYKLLTFSFKAKFYPWLLLLFFTILNQFEIQIDVLAGILFGYLSFYYISRFVEIPITTAISFERSVVFRWMTSFPSKSTFKSAFSNCNQINIPESQQSLNNPGYFIGKGAVVGIFNDNIRKYLINTKK